MLFDYCDISSDKNSSANLYDAQLGYSPTEDWRTVLVRQMKLAWNKIRRAVNNGTAFVTT